MPIFHILGNFTDGDGSQPVGVNDVSSIFQRVGVWHGVVSQASVAPSAQKQLADMNAHDLAPAFDAVFHQFGQCGWAHSLSYDGVHWKNVRHPLTPDNDPKHVYDQCGCWDGSLTVASGVNDGLPVILYAPQTSVPSVLSMGDNTTRVPSNLTSGDPPIMAVARASDLSDPELLRWTKDPQNPVAGSLSDMGQIWKNGHRWDGVSGGQMYSSNDSTLHRCAPETSACLFEPGTAT
jgi:hypothetical protein